MSEISDLATHPFAEKFPPLPEPELVELVESIRANGLRQPIVVTPDGLILDGRNRYVACARAGVEPETVVYEGDDLAEFVIDANVARRNMSTGARAMATALVLAEAGRRLESGRWKRNSVGIGGSANTNGWQDRLKEAGVVLDHAPDLADAVVTGQVALDAAHRQACERRDQAAKAAEAEEARAAEEHEAEQFITRQAPDLAAQVGPDGPYLTFTEALSIWNQRNREEAERLRREKAAATKAEREHREAMTDLYSGIAKCVQTAAGYGGYKDIDVLMAEFRWDLLHPPEYAREFTADKLTAAQRFITWLVDNVDQLDPEGHP